MSLILTQMHLEIALYYWKKKPIWNSKTLKIYENLNSIRHWSAWRTFYEKFLYEQQSLKCFYLYHKLFCERKNINSRLYYREYTVKYLLPTSFSNSKGCSIDILVIVMKVKRYKWLYIVFLYSRIIECKTGLL